MKKEQKLKEVDMVHVPTPELITWQELATIIHEKSYNGVMKFATNNNLKALKPGKKILFRKQDVSNVLWSL